MGELELHLPDYNQDAFNQRYVELGRYSIVIPPNPHVVGYDGLNRLISELQGYLDRVAEMLMEATRLHAISKAAYEAAKGNFEAQKDAFMAERSAKVEQYKSSSLIEAEVNNLLKEEKRLMSRAKIVMGLFSAYHKSVETKYKSLEKCKESLELQTNNFKRQNPGVGYSVTPGAQVMPGQTKNP